MNTLPMSLSQLLQLGLQTRMLHHFSEDVFPLICVLCAKRVAFYLHLIIFCTQKLYFCLQLEYS